MKKILLYLSIPALICQTSLSQSFTNEVDDIIVRDKEVYNFHYNVDEKLKIEQPVMFFMSYVGRSNEWSGILSHRGESVNLGDSLDFGLTMTFLTNYPQGNTPHDLPNYTVVIGPINEFFGDKQEGNWQLKIDTSYLMNIKNWGVFNIPEPTSFGVLLLGGCLLLIINKNYKK